MNLNDHDIAKVIEDRNRVKSLQPRWDRFLERELGYDYKQGMNIQMYFSHITGIDKDEDPVAVGLYGDRAGKLTDVNGIMLYNTRRNTNETFREKVFYERYHFIMLMEHFRYHRTEWDFYANL